MTVGRLGRRPTIAYLAHAVDGLAQIADPVVFVGADEVDAPRQGLAATSCHTRLDEGVEDLSFLESEAGHGRRVDGGEPDLGVAADDPPAHRAPELRVGLVGDRHALLAGGLAEGGDLLFVRQPGPGGTEITGHEDLIGVMADGGWALEPARGEGGGEPVVEIGAVDRWR